MPKQVTLLLNLKDIVLHTYSNHETWIRGHRLWYRDDVAMNGLNAAELCLLDVYEFIFNIVYSFTLSESLWYRCNTLILIDHLGHFLEIVIKWFCEKWLLFERTLWILVHFLIPLLVLSCVSLINNLGYFGSFRPIQMVWTRKGGKA